MKYYAALSLCLAVLLVTLSSASAANDSPTGALSQALQLPEAKTYLGTPYRSGGIGLEERDSLLAQEQNYNLKLVFALKEGDYLAQVPVSITDSTGWKVLEVIAEGPWLYTTLPPGIYQVTAEAEGESLVQDVHIPETGQTHLQFAW